VEEGRFAGLYDASFGLLLRRIHRRVAKIAGRHGCGQVIDLGCGTGAQCIILHDNKFDVAGMDMSSKMLEVARKKSSPDIKYIRGDIERTGFEDGSFDCAIISFVIHMNNEKSEEKIIQEARTAFLEMGFEEIVSPMVESAFWDFDALFQPQDHPARDMQDTFYLTRPGTAKLPDSEIVERVKRTHEDGGDTGSTGWGYQWSEARARQTVLRTHTTAAKRVIARPSIPASTSLPEAEMRNIVS
jgi:phenylalanyl-tRNA synthetase alpha subunit